MPDDESHADRRDRYHRLLNIIREQTGDPQPVLVSARALFATVRHSTIDPSAARRQLRAARERDAVIRWTPAASGPPDVARYGLDEAGIDACDRATRPLFTPADRPALEAVRDAEVQRDAPRQAIVGWVNRRLAALEDANV